MNIYANVQRLINKNNSSLIFKAIATGNATGNLEEVTRIGNQNPDTQKYPTLSSCPTLVNGDEVLVVTLGAGCIILGRIDS